MMGEAGTDGVREGSHSDGSYFIVYMMEGEMKHKMGPES